MTKDDPSALRARCDLDAIEEKAKAAQMDSMTGGIFNLPGMPSVTLAADVVLELVRRIREAEETIEEMRSNALERGER